MKLCNNSLKHRFFPPQLASIEWSMAKSRQAEAMNIAEQQQYGKVHSKVEQGIVKARYLPQYGRMHY